MKKQFYLMFILFSFFIPPCVAKEQEKAIPPTFPCKKDSDCIAGKWCREGECTHICTCKDGKQRTNCVNLLPPCKSDCDCEDGKWCGEIAKIPGICVNRCRCEKGVQKENCEEYSEGCKEDCECKKDRWCQKSDKESVGKCTDICRCEKGVQKENCTNATVCKENCDCKRGQECIKEKCVAPPTCQCVGGEQQETCNIDTHGCSTNCDCPKNSRCVKPAGETWQNGICTGPGALKSKKDKIKRR